MNKCLVICNYIKSKMHDLLVFVSLQACTVTVATLEQLRLVWDGQVATSRDVMYTGKESVLLSIRTFFVHYLS